MRSPFPGVDPFIEGQHSWQDFHVRFMNAWCEQIADRLPDNYLARLEETVEVVNDPEETVRRPQPDILVVQQSANLESGSAREPAGVLTPVLVPLPVEEERRQTSIRIVRLPDMRVISVLELLSPTNKQGDGYYAYLARRRQILNEDVNLVELDLLLGGRRAMEADFLVDKHCVAWLRRAERRQFYEVYSWTLRDRLPSLPLPLWNPDPDVFVDLQEVFETAYARGRYDRFLRYQEVPELSVGKPTLEWIRQTALQSPAD